MVTIIRSDVLCISKKYQELSFWKSCSIARKMKYTIEHLRLDKFISFMKQFIMNPEVLWLISDIGTSYCVKTVSEECQSDLTIFERFVSN